MIHMFRSWQADIGLCSSVAGSRMFKSPHDVAIPKRFASNYNVKYKSIPDTGARLLHLERSESKVWSVKGCIPLSAHHNGLLQEGSAASVNTEGRLNIVGGLLSQHGKYVGW